MLKLIWTNDNEPMNITDNLHSANAFVRSQITVKFGAKAVMFCAALSKILYQLNKKN